MAKRGLYRTIWRPSMGELKLETVTLRTNPAFVLDILRNYIARPDLDPDKLAEKKKLRVKRKRSY